MAGLSPSAVREFASFESRKRSTGLKWKRGGVGGGGGRGEHGRGEGAGRGGGEGRSRSAKALRETD